MSTLQERIKAVAAHSETGGIAKWSEAAGINKNTLYSYANGKSTPKPETLAALARVALVDVEWLADGNEDAAPPWIGSVPTSDPAPRTRRKSTPPAAPTSPGLTLTPEIVERIKALAETMELSLRQRLEGAPFGGLAEISVPPERALLEAIRIAESQYSAA